MLRRYQCVCFHYPLQGPFASEQTATAHAIFRWDTVAVREKRLEEPPGEGKRVVRAEEA